MEQERKTKLITHRIAPTTLEWLVSITGEPKPAKAIDTALDMLKATNPPILNLKTKQPKKRQPPKKRYKKKKLAKPKALVEAKVVIQMLTEDQLKAMIPDTVKGIDRRIWLEENRGRLIQEHARAKPAVR